MNLTTSFELDTGLFSFRFFRPILVPGPVGAVWNRAGFEKEDSKIEKIREFNRTYAMDVRPYYVPQGPRALRAFRFGRARGPARTVS